MAPQAPSDSTVYKPQVADTGKAALLPRDEADTLLKPGFERNADLALFLRCLAYCLLAAFPIGLFSFTMFMVSSSVGIVMIILVVGLAVLRLGGIVSNLLVYLDSLLLLIVFEGRVPPQLIRSKPNLLGQADMYNVRQMLRGVLYYGRWVLARFFLGIVSFVTAILSTVFFCLSLGFAYPILAGPICALAAQHLSLNLPYFLSLTKAAGTVNEPVVPSIYPDARGGAPGPSPPPAYQAPSYEAAIRDPAPPSKPDLE